MFVYQFGYTCTCDNIILSHTFTGRFKHNSCIYMYMYIVGTVYHKGGY